jgi:Mg-chelatase subunit ChlD
MQNYNFNKDNGNSYPIATVVAVPAIPAPDPQKDKNSYKKNAYKHNANETLKGQGFSEGLIQSITRSNDAFPLRIWVVDNSGSMNTSDGHRIHLTSDNRIRLLDCSRWAELRDTVSYHAQLAALLEAPTSFRLLNPAYGIEQFGVAERGPEHISEDLRTAIHYIGMISPSGVTPLSEHVREISMYVDSMKDQLNRLGQKAVVVIATDGLPTVMGKSSQYELDVFKQALRSLEGLPVWVVIRLCTDDDEVVDFYNNIDNDLELSLDVLDDFVAEAKEVYEHNNWLNYALPLHRMREMGFYHKLFDLIDERPLTRDELQEFFFLLFGSDSLDGLPDPHLDWQRFLDRVAEVNNKENLQWNPIKKRMMPWIDIRKLNNKFGDQFSCFLW